jgi:hypothetical protein
MIGRLAKRFEKENASGVRIALTQTLSDLGGKKAGRFFQTAVGHPRRPREATSPVVGPLPLAAIVSTVIRAVTTPEISVAERDERIVQLAAIEAAGRTERLEPLPQLIELLDDENADIRVAAAFALRRLTNLHYGIDWKAGSVLSMQRGRTRWRTAFERSKRASRNAWLVTGFKAAGYPVEAIDRGNVWHLARAVGGQDRLSYNAQRALMKLLKHEPKSLSWPKHDACAYWQRWMKRRRGRLKLPRPPKRSRCG